MEADKTEMSTLDILIPRYYKGYDMDDLLQKMYNRKSLTKEEEDIIDEVQDVYHKKYSEETQKKWDEQDKDHPEKYIRCVDPQRTDKR